MWLAKQLGTEYVENRHPQMTPQEVAGWMLDLHLKLVANNSKVVLEAKVAKDIKPNLVNTRMGLKELVRHAKQNTPELEAVSDDHAIALLANVFKQINQNAKDINKGNLVVPGLGRFQINQIKHEKDGQTGLTKRLIFHAPNTKREEGV
ncbi:MAG: hypothetical protein Q8N96_03860, partial [Methylovulum sp.]|nr:hypothetical protein [Methylovulum sp.]